MNQLICILICFLIGVLIYSVLNSYCSCNLIEGQSAEGVKNCVGWRDHRVFQHCMSNSEKTNLKKPLNCNLLWKQYELQYNVNGIQVTRKINYTDNTNSNKYVLYLGGTFEQQDSSNNMFCEYKDDDDKLKFGTDNGGYFYRNKCFLNSSLVNKYNIIQVPQMTESEFNLLIGDNNSNKQISPDAPNYWSPYNNCSPEFNCSYITNDGYCGNKYERYNYNIYGEKGKNPDKEFFKTFFDKSQPYFKNYKNNPKLFIGGYSGGSFMAGRLIYESIKDNLKWKKEPDSTESVKFNGAFILAGTFFNCIEPWPVDEQWCPRSMVGDGWKNNANDEAFDDLSNYYNGTGVKFCDGMGIDFYDNIDQIKNHPPTIFFTSPTVLDGNKVTSGDDTVNSESVYYYYTVLNNEEKHEYIEFTSPGEKNRYGHQWFDHMCDKIYEFIEKQS